MDLPTEVLDYILSFLQSEVAILEACAQSHPILSKLVERYLHANIILDEIRTPNNNCLRVVELRKLLSDSPYISNYVRNLTIRVRFHRKQHRLSDVVEISAILPRLSGLKTLTLCTIGDTICPWEVLPKAFRLAFLDFLNQGPPKEISIKRFFSFPLSLLDDCRTIKKLTLDGCSVVCPEGPRDQPGSTRLEHLFIRDCNDASLENIITWLQPCHVQVQSLTLSRPHKRQSFTDTSFQGLSRLLSVCLNSLTSLNICLSDSSQSLPDYSITSSTCTLILSALSTLPHLKCLVIHSTVTLFHFSLGPGGICNSILSAITQFLTTSPSSLKRLTLELDFFFYETVRRLSKANWSPLISLLTKCSFLGIKVYLSARFMRRGPESTPLPVISSFFAECKDLMQYIEQDVLVVIPRES